MRTSGGGWRVVVPPAPFLLAAAGLLLVGGFDGLQRMGWFLQWQAGGATGWHGFLLVFGFFGTLISLERAVALNQAWAFAVPLLHALTGWLMVLLGLNWPGARGWMLVASWSFVALGVAMLRRDPRLPTQLMVLAIGAWALAATLWALRFPFPTVVVWWQAFFVLTIAGERLELGRLTGATRRFRISFLVALGAYLLGGLLWTVFPQQEAGAQAGRILLALGMAGIGLWLLRFDVAWIGLRQQGLPRFIATSLLSGYAWLLIVAWLYVFRPGPTWYDGVLHGLFLGFVFSMVFGHAPIILPALVRRPLAFHPVLYLPLALLHLSMALRLIAGWVVTTDLWSWSGLGNGLAVLLYGVLTLLAPRLTSTSR